MAEAPTDDINNSFSEPEYKLVLVLRNQNQIFYLSLHYNGNQCYLYINRTQIFKLVSIIYLPTNFEFFVNGILYEAYTTYSQILGVKNVILNDVVVLLSFENQNHKM